jgi:NAD(P)-dependent dehydrogenase (short-subunit alcohol dehydrogenase family)
MTVWLITGCSSGFGREIALGKSQSSNRFFELLTQFPFQAALKKGDLVLATCRNDTSRLSDLQEAGAITLELDITSPDEKIIEFVRNILEIPEVKLSGGVDILLNNAGYVQLGALEEMS